MRAFLSATAVAGVILALMLGALVVGCSPKQPADPRDTPPVSERTSKPGESGEPADRGDKQRSESMPPGFAKAQAMFRDHAARALKTGEILVSPSEKSPAVQLDQRVGEVWAFIGSRRDRPEESVRGWATAEGVVVTPTDNLGVLFAEAGVFTDSPALAERELAERIVWAMGTNHRVLVDFSINARPPAMQRNPDGSGVLTFSVGYRQPGPGGAGGGPEKVSECTVTLTADHRATLQKSEWRFP